MPYIVTFITCICFVVTYTFEQKIVVETKLYNEENGLSRYVNVTHKDSRGIIWVGSQYGLYQFDGKEFKKFGLEEGLPFWEITDYEVLHNHL